MQTQSCALSCILAMISFSEVATAAGAADLVGGPAQSTNAMVSTAHPIATEVGIEILEQGGNAFDAAIAIAFTLTVVESNQSSAITGDGFGMFYLADTQELRTADWSSRTPLSPELEARVQEIDRPPLSGPG